MAKFPEAEARLIRNIFVCKDCKTKIRASNLKILEEKITCRNPKCKGKKFRPARKK